LVSHIEEETKSVGIRKWLAEEDIWG